MLSPDILQNLQSLLSIGKNEESDSDHEEPRNHYAKLGPADIAKANVPNKAENDGKQSTGNANNGNGDCIWTEEEVSQMATFDDKFDSREAPEYEILYKQAVTTEDIYLQMGNKTPATASCEETVVKIQLPNTQLKDMTLDIQPQFLDLRAPNWRLGLHLPHSVDKDNGKAEWDNAKKLLTVTLKNKREFDFMNF